MNSFEHRKTSPVGADPCVRPNTQLEGIDALVTRLPGYCLCISTADCVPILLYDPHTQAIAAIHAKGKKAGVVVKPRTPASAVLPFIDRVEMILVMTVEPGFGGQKFMADMMPKVQEIRRYIDAMNPGCELEVDGGVDPATCKICVASGANVLVAGSAVYKAADIPARIRELRG